MQTLYLRRGQRLEAQGPTFEQHNVKGWLDGRPVGLREAVTATRIERFVVGGDGDRGCLGRIVDGKVSSVGGRELLESLNAQSNIMGARLSAEFKEAVTPIGLGQGLLDGEREIEVVRGEGDNMKVMGRLAEEVSECAAKSGLAYNGGSRINKAGWIVVNDPSRDQRSIRV